MGTGLPSQGFFWWPGIESFLHGSFSFTHGISPSLATLYIAPQETWPDLTGDLEVSYLPGGQSYTFSNCLLDFISVEREPDGRQVWGLHILDRRWEWKDCGRISGNWNIRWQNGDGDTEVFTRNLLQLGSLMDYCLTAMGEQGYDISQVTQRTYPTIEWDYDNPATALLDLCDKYGYRVVLTLEDTVLIAKANQGAYLPDFQYLSGGTTINPPNTPSSIVVAAGRTLAQYDFPLVPMAIETDNTIVPLEDVSYKPDLPHGWGDADVPRFTCVKDPTARACAIKSVWKYFQVGTPFEMPGIDLTDPENDEIEDVMRVLPLYDTQLVKAPKQQQPKPDDTQSPYFQPGQPLPAVVYGIFWTYEGAASNSKTEIDSSKPMLTREDGRYMDSFSIEGERGLVIFDDFVYALPQQEGEAGYKVPPTLFLRASCNVRDDFSLGFLRAEVARGLPTAGIQTLPQFIKTDDVARKVIFNFTGFGEVQGSSDNIQQVNDQAKFLLDAAVAKLTLLDPQSFEYPGFVFLDMDGAIQQLTWTVGEDGKATTQANRNKEDLVNTPSYQEAKQAALLQAALSNKEKVGRVLKQDLSQSLTTSGLGPNVSK